MSDVLLLQQLSEAAARVAEAKVLASTAGPTVPKPNLDEIAEKMNALLKHVGQITERTTKLAS